MGVCSPVSPEKVFLLLSDLWQRVPVTQLSQLLSVALCQGVISGHTIALRKRKETNKTEIKRSEQTLLPASPASDDYGG